MPHKGYKQSEEQKELRSKRMLGHTWNKGKKRTDEFKKNLSERISGKNHPLYGSKMSEETKKKISDSEKGKIIPLEVRAKMSESRLRAKNPAWNGGKSFEKYTDEWDNKLKNLVRERDLFICQECGIHQDELSDRWHKKLDVHHIDYNKKNCGLDNLIALCRQCHVKTNYNREYWLNYFNNKNYE